MSADPGLRVVPLDWDTRFFGFAIGALTLEGVPPAPAIRAAADAARARAFRLLVVTDAADGSGAVLAPLGARRVDTKLDFAAAVRPATLPRGIEAIPAAPAPADRDALDALALASGAHSRFRTDPRFGEAAWTRLYRAWMDNSVSGTIADAVLVHRDAGRITGFATIRACGDREARIGLLAVAADRRGRGIGGALIGAVHRWASDRDLRTILVATQQDNAGACRFYQGAGFEVSERLAIHHLWLD